MTKRHALDAVLATGMVAVLAAVVLAFLTVRVSGTSMEPTLVTGDNLLADKISILWRAPARGDLVEIELPNGVTAVKRVIALPGDAIEIDGSTAAGPGPRVLLRPHDAGPWLLLDEPYLRSGWLNQIYCCDGQGRATSYVVQPYVLPPGDYFVMGDNRNVSEDSRVFGPVPKDRLVGRVMFRYWPWGRAAGSFPRLRLISAA